MVLVIIAMLLALGTALVVMGYVAVTARRQGQDLLTPHGEQVVSRLRERRERVRGHGMSPVPGPARVEDGAQPAPRAS